MPENGGKLRDPGAAGFAGVSTPAQLLNSEDPGGTENDESFLLIFYLIMDDEKV